MKSKFKLSIILFLIVMLSSCKIWNNITGKTRKEREARQQFENTLYEQKRVLQSNLKTLERIQQDIDVRIANNPNTTVKNLTNEIFEIRQEITSSVSELETLEEQKNLTIDGMISKNKRMNRKVQGYTQRVLALNRVLEFGNKDNILKFDLSFETGSSTLKNTGKTELDKVISDIYLKINQWNDYENGLYRTQTKKIQINVIGYADKQGLGDVFSRMKMNQELSEARASSVSNYLKSKLINTPFSSLEINAIGLGEALPPNTFDDNKLDNPQRRVCLISVTVFPER